jgi:hypothetical protein
MQKRSRSKPRQTADVNQAAHEMVLRSTGQLTSSEISRFMKAMGSKGGKRGGLARAAGMTDKERSDSASKAARAKWAKIRAEKLKD